MSQRLTAVTTDLRRISDEVGAAFAGLSPERLGRPPAAGAPPSAVR